jgi:iron(III) transport system substrate-binding protein
MIINNYGEAYAARMRSLNTRLASGGVPAIQSLAAGEGAINSPSIVPLVLSVKNKGAKVDYVMPDINTGVESYVVLTARSKAKHPAAARLLANYVLTQEGNKVVNADPGSVTLYDTAGLPRQYESPNDSGGMARLEQLAKQLGFQ